MLNSPPSEDSDNKRFGDSFRELINIFSFRPFFLLFMVTLLNTVAIQVAHFPNRFTFAKIVFLFELKFKGYPIEPSALF